jgi:hypothetical protein
MAGDTGKRKALIQKFKAIFHLSSRSESTPKLSSRPTLETLPPELRCRILSALATLDDLKSAVRASPVLYQQYRADRKSILGSVLRHTLGDQVFVDAYAVQTSAPLVRPPYLAAHLAVQLCMTEYQTNRKNPSLVSRECVVGDLVGMAAFYTFTVKPLMEGGIPRLLLCNLKREAQLGFLSATERTRILRAMYRFQLWCNLYGTGELATTRIWGVDPFDMLLYFFEVFEPWEAEEISCIHKIFMGIYHWVFKWDVDGDSIRFVDSYGVERLIPLSQPLDNIGEWFLLARRKAEKPENSVGTLTGIAAPGNQCL